MEAVSDRLLTASPQDEFVEVMESTQSTVVHFVLLEGAAQDEASHQLSQHRQAELATADGSGLSRAVMGLCMESRMLSARPERGERGKGGPKTPRRGGRALTLSWQ